MGSGSAVSRRSLSIAAIPLLTSSSPGNPSAKLWSRFSRSQCGRRASIVARGPCAQTLASFSNLVPVLEYFLSCWVPESDSRSRR